MTSVIKCCIYTITYKYYISLIYCAECTVQLPVTCPAIVINHITDSLYESVLHGACEQHSHISVPPFICRQWKWHIKHWMVSWDYRNIKIEQFSRINHWEQFPVTSETKSRVQNVLIDKLKLYCHYKWRNIHWVKLNNYSQIFTCVLFVLGTTKGYGHCLMLYNSVVYIIQHSIKSIYGVSFLYRCATNIVQL